MEIIFFVIILVLVIIGVYYHFKVENKKVEEAGKYYRSIEADYFNSLTALKKHPNNPELREQTLAKGRAYSALTRQHHGQGKSVTIFDEIALMNDINAACAAATIAQPKVKTEMKNTIEQRLEELSELRGKSLISQQEYETKRQNILDEI